MSIAKIITQSSRLAVLLWMALIFHLSSKPVLPMKMLFSWQDKVMHLLFYGVLGIFLALALGAWEKGLSRQYVILVTVLAALYGISDEFHQMFVPGRSPSMSDIVADTLGGLLAALILKAILPLHCFKRSN